ncbi:HdeD family acid-resistance protein [Streptomyces sparsus]
MVGRKSSTGPKSEAGLTRSLGWLSVLGAVLVIGGLIGLVYVWLATITTVLLFGWLLLIGGVVALLHAVQSHKSNFFWLGLIVAALYIAAGAVVVLNPATSAAGLTLFAALLFLTGGVFRLVGGLVARGPQMIWTVAQGALGVLLGVLVLIDWPQSTLYTLGAFFSLALLFDGIGLLATGITGRHVAGLVAQGRDDADRQREEREGRDERGEGDDPATRPGHQPDTDGPGRRKGEGTGHVEAQ